MTLKCHCDVAAKALIEAYGGTAEGNIVTIPDAEIAQIGEVPNKGCVNDACIHVDHPGGYVGATYFLLRSGETLVALPMNFARESIGHLPSLEYLDHEGLALLRDQYNALEKEYEAVTDHQQLADCIKSQSNETETEHLRIGFMQHFWGF